MPPPIDPAVLARLAATYDTPLYVLSGERIRSRVKELRRALPPDGRMLYSVKANPAPRIIRLLANLGLDFDVCSPGDLALAFAAGCSPARLSFVGCGMASSELEDVVRQGIPFVADSIEQVRRYVGLCRGGTLGLRLNPGLQSGFHPDVQAGRRDAKFGIPLDALGDALALAGSGKCKVIGLHGHVGSEIGTHKTHLSLLAQLLACAEEIPTAIWVNIGGGWSIPIHDEAAEAVPQYDLGAFGAETSAMLSEFSARTGRPLELRVEPGSYLMMDAGCLVVRVTEIKEGQSETGEARRFVFTDGSTDLVYSASVYRTRHPVWSMRDAPSTHRRGWSLVGPLMQAGDILAEDPWLPDVEVGDLLAFGMCGAYKAVRASNFNERVRPAEVMVDGVKAVVLRRRETLEDLLSSYPTGESSPEECYLIGSRG